MISQADAERLKAAGWELVVGDGAHHWRKDEHAFSGERALQIEGLGAEGPSVRAADDFDDDFVCPNGHRFIGVRAIQCDECEALIACVPLAMELAIREHRATWISANGKNPDIARPADLKLWEAIGGIEGQE